MFLLYPSCPYRGKQEKVRYTGLTSEQFNVSNMLCKASSCNMLALQMSRPYARRRSFSVE